MRIKSIHNYLDFFVVVVMGSWPPVSGHLYTSQGVTQEMISLYSRSGNANYPQKVTESVEDCALWCAGEDHCPLYMKERGERSACVYFRVLSTLPQPSVLNTETRRERTSVLVQRDEVSDTKCESTSDPSTGKINAEAAVFLPFGKYFIFSQSMIFKVRKSGDPNTDFCLEEVITMNRIFLRVDHPVRALFVHKLANDTYYRVHVVDDRGNHFEYFGGHARLRPRIPVYPLVDTRHNLWLLEGNMSEPQDAIGMLRESMAFKIIPCGLLNISDQIQVNVSDVIYTCALRVTHNMTFTYRVKIEAYALTFWEVKSPLHGQPSDVTALMMMEDQSGYVAFVGSEMFMYMGSATGVPVQSTLYGHFIKS